jgi:hypothetical protein
VDLFDVVRACIRRWYVFLPLLLIAALYSLSVYNSVKPVYYSSATIGIAPPNEQLAFGEPGVPIPRNGLMDLGGGNLIPNLLVLALRDPDIRDEVVKAGGTTNYSSRMFPVSGTSPELPLVMIDATDPDPTVASKTVQLVAAQADPVLRTLQQQAGVPDAQMVKPLVVLPSSPPVAAMPARTRSTITILAAGLGIAILMAVVVDVLLMRRKARGQKRRQTPVETAGGADTADAAESVEDTRNRHATAEVAVDRR